MEAYRNWVRRNKDYVHSMESLANGMTWLLPERFSASEIGPEAVTAVLGIFTAINEHIIDTDPRRSQMGSSEPSSYPWSLGISILKDLETLVEVMAEQFYGEDKKWNFIAVTEATKVLLRLALFRDGGYKMLLQGGEAPNEETSHGDSNSENNRGSLTKPGGHHGPGYIRDHHGRDPRNLEGRALSALSKFGEDARLVSNPTWLNRLQNQHALTMESPTSVVVRPTLSTIWSEKGLYGALFLMAEVMHISRPLIYVLFIRKYGVRSWIPWILSLCVDLTGMSIISYVTHPRHSRKIGCFPLSPSEQNEIKRRKLLWAFYLMRDPFFSKYTRGRFEHIEKVSEPVPIIGFLTENEMKVSYCDDDGSIQLFVASLERYFKYTMDDCITRFLHAIQILLINSLYTLDTVVLAVLLAVRPMVIAHKFIHSFMNTYYR